MCLKNILLLLYDIKSIHPTAYALKAVENGVAGIGLGWKGSVKIPSTHAAPGSFEYFDNL